MREWEELFFAGSERTIRAFVLGFAAAKGESGVVFGSDIELEPEAFGERLKALFARGSHHVAFVPRTLAGPLADAVAVHGAALGLRIERRRVVQAASFPFRIEAFSRDEAGQLRTMLVDSLPAGAHVEALSEGEETHPEASGPEPFAPLHAYTYRASGRVMGAFEAVIDVWKRSQQLDFTEVGCISVHGNPVQ